MKFLRFISIIVLISIIFASCDKVDCPACGKGSIPINGDTIFKKVLLEDYTAFGCPNCPEAAAIAHELKDLYGDRLVIMAMHVGLQAMPIGGNYSYDFRTTTGDAWDNFFNVYSGIGLPAGMVNRIGYPVQSSYLHGRGNWGTEVAKIILDTADANIEIHTNLNSASRELEVDIDAYFYKDLIGTYFVNVCVIEDSIIYTQDSSVVVILDYNHMHVLRGSVSNIWGDSLTTDPMADSSAYHVIDDFPIYTIGSDRELKNCSVVAFIYRKDNTGGGKFGQYEIVQAEVKKIQ